MKRYLIFILVLLTGCSALYNAATGWHFRMGPTHESGDGTPAPATQPKLDRMDA